MTFTVTNDFTNGTSADADEVNTDFEDVENELNEVTSTATIWDATKQLVGTVTSSGGPVLSFGLTGLSVDLDDYDLSFVAQLDKDTDERYLNIVLNGDAITAYNSQNLQCAGGYNTSATASNSQITRSTATAEEYTVIGTIVKSKSNLPVIYSSSMQEAGNTSYMAWIRRDTALTNNIVTAVAITGSGEEPIVDGSILTVYKIRRQV